MLLKLGIYHRALEYYKVYSNDDPASDMLSGTKIAGQLRKNSSGHATRIFAKMSRKFEIPAVRLKGFLQSCTCVSLTRIKNINIPWHLIPLSGLSN